MQSQNNNPVSVTAVPFNPQTQTFTPAPIQPAVQPVSTSVSSLPANLPTPKTTITADTIGTQKIPVPTSPIIPTVPQPVNLADQLLKDTAVAETEAQKVSQDLSKSILSLIPNLQGQTQELAIQQQAQKLPELRQNLQNINNQILQKQAELQQDDIRLVQSVQNIEDKPIAMEFITGQQQSVQRNAQIARALKASEIGVLNATALGMQGNIALAEATAKQAVETKYAPYKELLDTYKMQLEALQPILSSDEKKQAREQNIKTELALKDLDRQKQNEDESRKMLIKAIAQGLPQSIAAKAQDQINKGASSDTVAITLGIYAGDVLERKIKQAQLAKLGIDVAKGQKELSSITKTLSPEDTARFNSTPQVKNTLDAITYAKALQAYRDNIAKYGTGEFTGTGKGALGAAYSALVGATKDYYQLGTLDNGVQRLIDLGISEPGFFQRADTQYGAINQAMSQAKDSMKTNINQLGKGAYRNSIELNSIVDEVANLEMQTQSLNELLNQLPSQGSNGQDNSAFFGSNTTTPAMVK